MKITSQQLRTIIKEEVQKIQAEVKVRRAVRASLHEIGLFGGKKPGLAATADMLKGGVVVKQIGDKIAEFKSDPEAWAENKEAFQDMARGGDGGGMRGQFKNWDDQAFQQVCDALG